MMLMTILSLIIIQLFALMTPGPDFLLVSQTAVSRTRRESVFVVLGITVGVMIWAALALLGLNVVFEQIVWLKRALFIGGGLYLTYIGWQMLCAALRPPLEEAAPKSNSNEFLENMASGQYFIKGLLTNLSNPKAIIYFSSVFSLFLNQPQLQGWHYLLFVIVTLETLFWFLLVMFVLSLPQFKSAYIGAIRWIDGVAGGLFVGFGLYLLGQK